MGSLVTLTFHCDHLAELEGNPGEFAKKLLHCVNSCSAGEFSVGRSPFNFVKVHRPRHADDNALYVHMGNTVCELSVGSPEVEDLRARCPDFLKEMLDYLRSESVKLQQEYGQTGVERRG